LSLEGREIEIVQILQIMYFSISIIIWIVSHDVGCRVLVCHMGCFVSLDCYKDPEAVARARGAALWALHP
jgi:hypothetical protein